MSIVARKFQSLCGQPKTLPEWSGVLGVVGSGSCKHSRPLARCWPRGREWSRLGRKYVGRKWSEVVGSGRKWSGVVGSGREWSGVSGVVGNGREWSGMERSKMLVVGSGREWPVRIPEP